MIKLKNKSNSNSTSQLDNVAITTVIGPEIKFLGEISGSKTIKIDGFVKGNVYVENGIILGEKAVIEGDLKSKNIIIFGKVVGNINSNELMIKKTGSVNGNINTNTIEIEIGGKYNGQLKMSSNVDSLNASSSKQNS